MFAGYVVTLSRPYLKAADAMTSHPTLEAGGLLADDIGGRVGTFLGEPVTIQGMFAIRGLLEAGREEHVGWIGGLGLDELKQVTGELQDLPSGRIVIRE